MSGRTLGTGGPSGCPTCGTPLPLASSRPSIERPLQQCAGCGGFVIRPGATEWDFLKLGEKVGHVARHTFAALTGGLALPLAHAAIEFGAGRAWQPRDLLLWLAAGWALAGTWAGSRLVAKIRRSRRRMRDPMYLAKLVEHEIAGISGR